MKTVYSREKETYLIKNTIIERMFMSICNDEQMQIYVSKANSTDPAVKASATAYASAKVEKFFMYWRDTFIKQNGDLEYLNFKLFERK